MTIEPFKKLSEEIVWENPYWKHVKATFELPDGSTKEYEYPSGGNFSMMIPVNREGKVLVQVQYRQFVDAISYEFPAGRIDPGETPEQTAHRELAEETGLAANSVWFVGDMFVSPGATTNRSFNYVMTDLEKVDQPEGDEYELEHFWMTVEEVDALIADGKMKDGPAVTAWLLAKPKVLELIDSQS